MKYNFHTHSYLDDGQMAMEDYVIEAIEHGFDALGFSGHSPLPIDNEWSIKSSDLPSYINQAKQLKEKYQNQIKLYLGLEIDYTPGMSDDFDAFRNTIPLDYCIGSVHLVRHPASQEVWFIDGPEAHFHEGLDNIFGGDVRLAVTAYFEQSIQMVETQHPDIIGHLDKVKMYNRGRYFDANEAWYQALTDRLLEAIKRHNVIVEVNTRGVYTRKIREYFPSAGVLEKCLRLGIPVMINSDAHQPCQISSQVEEAEDLLRSIGFKKVHTPFAEYPL